MVRSIRDTILTVDGYNITSTWGVSSVQPTTRYWESQVSLAVTLWLSGEVIDWTFTLGGEDVHAQAYSLITVA